jgi:hypothetical protein
MTPYELRFEIFKQAQKWIEFEYNQKIHQYNVETDRFLENGDTTFSTKKPEMPSFQTVLETANKINKFVSNETK